MPDTQILRARKRQGSNSLELTVPARICRDFDIQHGDVFEISSVQEKGEVKLTYRRVYRKR